MQSRSDLAANGSLLKPQTVVSLAKVGYDFAEKVEGLAIVSDEWLAVVNDNDFGVNGDLDLSQSQIPLTRERRTVLGWVRRNK